MEHKLYCPEDMYGQEFLKFYIMTAFLTTWTTTSPNESITIPTTGGGYLYDVAWGDGTITMGHTGDATHVYTNPGDYQISITGDFPRICFECGSSDNDKILSVDQWGTQQWSSMEGAFFGCGSLSIMATDNPDLSNTSTTKKMFSYSSVNEDISSWDVSNIMIMDEMFVQADNFNQDISLRDVSSVTSMNRMFKDTDVFNQDISAWDVSSVTNTNRMFQGSVFNQDISSWDVSSVTNMSHMFADTPFNQNIASWDVSAVTNMSHMFDGSDFNQNIASWDVGSVENMGFMFMDTPFNQDIGSWNVSNVNEMRKMFENTPFNQDIGSWVTSSVIDLENMFRNSPFNQDIASWDVSNVIEMPRVFENTPFNQDLSNWNIANAYNLDDIFNNSGLSTENYDAFLIGMAGQSLQSNVEFGAGLIQYCASAEARSILINTYSWNISDGGQVMIMPAINTFTNGNATNNWNEAGNWSLAVVPTATHEVIIPNGQSVIVPDHTEATEDGLCYTIEVEDGAVFEVMDGATFRTAVPCNY